MPPRSRPDFSNNNRKKKKAVKAPETADEFLAAGVEQEESGERWRSGDVEKAARFFLRAIEVYETALSKFPNCFDARYNRARLQYHLTQLPLPTTFFPSSSTSISRLEQAELSHRECLTLEPESADILFNYGQVLASLAEAYINIDASKALAAAQQAIQTFQKCLSIQEQQYNTTLVEDEVWRKQALNEGPIDESMQVDDGEGVEISTTMGANMPKPVRSNSQSSSTSSTNSGQWAAIVEPTTRETLLDTALAQIEVYTTLLTLFTDLHLLDELYMTVAQLYNSYVLNICDTLPERRIESHLANSNFQIAVAEVRYKISQTAQSFQDWENAAKTSFSIPLLVGPIEIAGKGIIEADNQQLVDISWQARCDRSTAYVSLANTLSYTLAKPVDGWKYYSLAASDLSAAAKMAPEKNHSEIALARGNLDLVRSRIQTVEAAVKNRELLRKNALVYYGVARQAGNSGLIGANDGGGKGVVMEAKIKDAVVRTENGEKGLMQAVVKEFGSQSVKDVMKMGLDDGLWNEEGLKSVLAESR